MQIDKTIEENKYTFSAVLKCEFCGKTQKLHRGFNSEYYKTVIIANIQCHNEVCKKQTTHTVMRSR